MYKPPGDLYLEGGFNGGFFVLPFWEVSIWRDLHMEGLIFGILRYSCPVDVLQSELFQWRY